MGEKGRTCSSRVFSACDGRHAIVSFVQCGIAGVVPVRHVGSSFVFYGSKAFAVSIGILLRHAGSSFVYYGSKQFICSFHLYLAPTCGSKQFICSFKLYLAPAIEFVVSAQAAHASAIALLTQKLAEAEQANVPKWWGKQHTRQSRGGVAPWVCVPQKGPRNLLPNSWGRFLDACL